MNVSIKGFAHLGRLLHETLFGSPKVVEEEFDPTPIEHTLFLKWETCGTCGGKGTHVNPSIDSNGLSSEDFEEDTDFHESYIGGMYDVNCYECRGRTMSPVIDRTRTSPEAIKAADEWFESEATDRREQDAERRMGY